MDKIYTKTGDKGTTSNFLGKQFSKGDIEIELQGGIDEINAYVGHMRSLINKQGYDEDKLSTIDGTLKEIQYHLYCICIEIATEFTEVHITEDEVTFLEHSIDDIDTEIEPLKSFIYYSVSFCGTFAHMIRTIVRRIERVYVRFLQGKNFPICYLYINRLSDYFFSLARYLNALDGVGDEPMLMR